jgi:hypothetical protein
MTIVELIYQSKDDVYTKWYVCHYNFYITIKIQTFFFKKAVNLMKTHYFRINSFFESTSNT